MYYSSLFSKKNIVRLLVFIALVVLGFFLIPFNDKHYNAQLVTGSAQVLAEGQRVFYCDMDDDGTSEEFIYYHFSDNRQPIVNEYAHSGDLINIWYLDGEIVDYFDFITGDYDHDGIKEVYCFAKMNGILYLYGMESNRNNQFCVKKALICSLNEEGFVKPVVIHPGGMADLNGDGDDEVVFSVSSRFSPTPRRLFAYDVSHGQLSSSPELGLQLVGTPILFDINNDHFPEVFLATLNSAAQSWAPSGENVEFSQSVVLDHNLQFFFQPQKYKSRMSVTAAYPLQANGKQQIAVVSWSVGLEEEAILNLLDVHGGLIKKRSLGKQSFVFDPKRSRWNEIFLFSHNSCLLKIDSTLHTVDSIVNHDLTNQVAFIDIDSDKQDECIIFKDNQIEIYRKDFQYKTTIVLPGLRARKIYLSMKENGNGTRYLSVQNDNYQFFIEYKQNSYYWTGYFWYFLSALFVLVVLVLVINLYQHQLAKQRQRQQEFFQLKFDLLKSSLDPHFLFNALNSISFSINKDDRKTAYSNLGIFSKFMRESLSSVESFEHDFGEELNYIKNYLKLEKFRFKELFDYTIIISPEVNMTAKVPRLSLFCFIENALKKGVLSKKGGGFIELSADISSDKKALVVRVTDNGIYRDLTNDTNYSQNFKVVLRLFELLNQGNREHIQVSMKPNISEDKPMGCCIELFIPFDYNFTIQQ
jgi:hypothetical protein